MTEIGRYLFEQPSCIKGQLSQMGLMRRLSLVLCALLALGSVGHAASVVSGFPQASQPLGNIPDAVLLDQGTGCPGNVPPCTTSQSPSLRVGQPFQSTVAPGTPFKYQLWWDTTVSGTPVLKIYDGSTWNLTGTLDTTAHTWLPSFPSETANTAFLGPATGAAAAPAFRALVGADLPNPAATSLGGVQSITHVPHFFLDSISTLGVPHASQPVCADLSNSGNGCPNTAIAPNRFLGGPSLGAAAAPTFRAITRSDVPTLAGVLDGLSYGIRADGITSDDVAIQTAFAACAAAGKTLMLPQGQILIDGSAVTTAIIKNCHIIGHGVPTGDSPNRGTTFLLTSTVVKPFIIGSNWSMEGVSFYWPNQTSGTTVYPPLFSDDTLSGADDVTLRQTTIINAYDGFKQTVPLGWSRWNISDSYFYAVHDTFSIANTPDSWRMTNVEFAPGPWINILGLSPAVQAAINAAAQVNSMFHVTGNGTTGFTLFTRNFIGFAYRYGFNIDVGGALTNGDIVMSMDGTGTFVDSSSGGITSGTTFSGAGNNSFRVVYVAGAPTFTGNDPAFFFGGNGDATIRDFGLPLARGSAILTKGASLTITGMSANYAQALDGTNYYGLELLANVSRVELLSSDFFGQADIHSHGIFATSTLHEMRIQNNSFINLNEAMTLSTTGTDATMITGNFSSGTVGANTVVISGTGPVSYRANQFDKAPNASVSNCGTSPSVSGATSGIIQIGSGGPVTSCKLTLPWVVSGVAPTGVCIPVSTISTLSISALSGSPASWTFASTGAVDMTGGQIFFNCGGEQ